MKQTKVYVGSYSLPVGVTENKPGEFDIQRKAGGLAIGVESAFTEGGEYVKAHWMGIREAPQANGEELNKQLTSQYGFSYLFLPVEEKTEFYSQAVNGVLWPLTHAMPEKIGHESSLNIYEKVNEDFANKLYEKIEFDLEKSGGHLKDVQVWLHDSHLASVPKFLKKKNSDLNISYFHHTTWPEHKPEKETLKYFNKKLGKRTNPIRTGKGTSYSPEGTIKRQDEIRLGKMIENLMQADSLGFHTQTDADDFLHSAENFQLIRDNTGSQKLKNKLFVNPIGIPKKKIENELKQSIAELQNPTQELRERIEKWKEEVIPQAQEKHRNKLIESANRLSEGIGSLHDLQSLELSLAANDRIGRGKETPFDREYLENGQLFNPKKIQIGSVQRFDYTKGVHVLLAAFREILQDKKANGTEHPDKDMQLNLVCSSARNIPAYAEYERVAMEQIKAINLEFPGAVNYIPGIPNVKLPAFNASNEISTATSKKDGYILSIGEAILARHNALESGYLPLDNQHSGSMVSNTAGISESLGGKERTSKINALAIVEPTIKGVKKGFTQLLDRIEKARETGVVDNQGFQQIPSLITDTGAFGKNALDFASKTKKKDLSMLTRTSIQKSTSEPTSSINTRSGLKRKNRDSDPKERLSKQIKM